MKKIFTLSFLLLSLSSINAQGIEIYVAGETTEISGTEYIHSGANTTLHIDFDIKNTSGNPLDLGITRSKLIESVGSADYLCWGISLADGNCYDTAAVSPNNPWSTPDGTPAATPDNAAALLSAYYHHGGTSGSSLYRYYVVNISTGDRLDSVDLKFESTLSLEKNNNIVLDVYPNPASDYLTVNAEKINGNITISVFDLVGKEVAKAALTSGKNQLNLSDLRTGVYFYSIIRDNVIIETKKLIVK